jgi:hypothetical protein
MYRFTQIRLALALICCLLFTACPLGDSLAPQAVIAGAPVLINELVRSKKLTEAQGEKLKRDFDDGAVCALTLEDSLDQIDKKDPDARSRKRGAWLRAAQCWQPIVLRQNFGADSQVQHIAALITDAFAAGVAFYTDRERSVGSDAAGTVVLKSEAAFDREMKDRMKEIKEAMKPE